MHQTSRTKAKAPRAVTPRSIAPDEELNSIVRHWVSGHRKAFWKYEVSCFSRPFKISIGALPDPSVKDIAISPSPGAMKNEKEELCETIRGLLDKRSDADLFRVDILAERVDGSVKTTVVHKGKPASAAGEGSPL